MYPFPSEGNWISIPFPPSILDQSYMFTILPSVLKCFNTLVYSRFNTLSLSSFYQRLPITLPSIDRSFTISLRHILPLIFRPNSQVLTLLTHHQNPLTNYLHSCSMGGSEYLFLGTDDITHVRSHQPYDILVLYRLQSLLPLFPLLSHDILWSITLHYPPLHLVLCISSALVRDISFPSSIMFKPCYLPISYCFSFWPLPTSSDWTVAFMLDSETRLILESL